ncbi:MAG: SRPBCC family protein [Bacteroidota bacterium]
MRVIQNLFFGAIAFLATMVVISFFLPEKYTVEKSIHINAPQEIVFEQVNDLSSWKHWSYFANLDTEWKVDFGNWTSGQDASMKWKSQQLGDGKLDIVESLPYEKISAHFKYKDSGKSSFAEYLFKDAKDGTLATIRLQLSVPLTPKDKFEYIFFKPKEKSEDQFNYSLNQLKAVSEKVFREKLDE